MSKNTISLDKIKENLIPTYTIKHNIIHFYVTFEKKQLNTRYPWSIIIFINNFIT